MLLKAVQGIVQVCKVVKVMSKRMTVGDFDLFWIQGIGRSRD
jgi:hypothetical protein